MSSIKQLAAILLVCAGFCLPLLGTASMSAAAAETETEQAADTPSHARNHAAEDSGASQGDAERGEHSSAQGGHRESSGGLLSFDIGSYLWKIIIFTVFLFVLAKWVWPPILKGLQDREEKQRGDLQSAEDSAKEANEKLEQYRQQLAEAQKESQRIIEQSRAEAQRLDAQQKEQTQHDIHGMRDRAASEIESAKQQAIAEMYEQTATVATQIAGRILQRELRPEDHRDLVNRAVDDIPTATHTTRSTANTN